VLCWGWAYEGRAGVDPAQLWSPVLVADSGIVAQVSGAFVALEARGRDFCAVRWNVSHDGQESVCWGPDYGTSTSAGMDWSPKIVTNLTLNQASPPMDVVSSNVTTTGFDIGFTPATCGDNCVVQDYEVSLDGGDSWTTMSANNPSAPTLSLTSLSPGRQYSVVVRGLNQTGRGVSSSALNVVTAPVPANAPVIGSVLSGNARTTLEVIPPSAIGDLWLTGYDYSIDNGQTWSHFASTDGPFVISGLTNATAYQIKVRAVNTAGPGTASEAVTVNPTKLVPAVPVITSVTRDNGQATVNVATASGVTAQSITGYQYNVNNGALWKPVTLNNGSFTVTGLTNGTNYSFRVRAVNANGLSAMSGKVAVTPMTTASASTIQSIKSLNGGLAVTFGGAIDNGGSVARNYQYSLNGGTSWLDCSPALKFGPTMVIRGLTNGTTYQVAIRLVNAVGPGAASNVMSGTPMATPTAPVISGVVVGKTSAAVSFAGVTNGGSAISGYAYSLDNKVWTSFTPVDGQLTVTGLTAYKSYKVYVRASNLMGNGVAGSKSFRTLK
jgi:titin